MLKGVDRGVYYDADGLSLSYIEPTRRAHRMALQCHNLTLSSPFDTGRRKSRRRCRAPTYLCSLGIMWVERLVGSGVQGLKSCFLGPLARNS